MTTLQDKEKGEDFLLPNGKFGKVGVCRSVKCNAKVVFVALPSGKTPPYNEDGISHFATCPDAESFKGKARA
jgi:hypothetical protein